jgi:hypothetical protein
VLTRRFEILSHKYAGRASRPPLMQGRQWQEEEHKSGKARIA